MTKWALLLAVTFFLPACSHRTEQAQEILKSRLAEKKYVEFQNLENFPGGVVCGEFHTNDPMRGNSRYRRFIVWGDMAEEKPSQEDWDIFCSKDPSAALFSTFGIGPVGDTGSQLPRIRGDLTLLQAALAQYLADNFFLPSTEQGLAALVSATTIRPLPMKFKPGGYLPSLPEDPWGNPYLYERSGLGGIAQKFRIYTLGADGVAGGKGKNSDVSTKHLKYLDHIDR